MLRSVRTSPIALVFGILACAASGRLLAAAATDQPQDGPQLQQWYAPPAWYRIAPSRAEGQHRISSEIETIATPLAYTFTPISPCRQYNSLNATPLLQATNRAVTLIGAPCNIPATAVAVSVNITVFSITGASGNAVFKVDTVSPPASAWINYPSTETQRANAGVVPLNGSGQIIVQVAQSAGQVDFIVDVNGYYTATTLAASVNGDGSLARGVHATGSSKLATGDYEIDFDRDLTPCFYVASLGVPNTSSAPPGTATTALRAGNNMAVFVQTADGSGVITDEPFMLSVTCPP